MIDRSKKGITENAPIYLSLFSAGLCALFVAADFRLHALPSRPISIHGVVLALIVFALSLKPLNFEVGSGGMFVDLSEVALVFGLYCTDRRSLAIAVGVGIAGGVGMRQRRSPIKVLFNVSTLAAGYAIALFIFDIANRSSVKDVWSWLAVAVSVITLNLSTFIAVCGVLHFTGDPTSTNTIKQATIRNVVQSVFTSAIGISVLLLLTTGPFAAAMVTILIGGIVGLLRVNDRHRRDHEAYRIVHRLTEDLRSSDSLPKTLQTIAEHSVRSVNASSVTVIILGAQVHKTVVGPDLSVPIEGDTVYDSVVGSQKSMLLVNGSTSRAANTYLRSAGLRDLIAAPLMSNGIVIGYIVAANHVYEGDVFGRHDVELLEQIGAQAATSIRNHDLIGQLRVEAEKHLHQANHDPLTGLANRPAFLAIADSLLTTNGSSHRRRVRDGDLTSQPPVEDTTKVGLFFIDLNHFKAVNDSLGHQAGDELLLIISDRIRSVVPEDWTAARLGGDEFAIIGPFTDEGEIDSLVEDLQESIRRSVDIAGERLTPSAAIGVAFAPEHATTRAALMRRADVAMYAAKSSGERLYFRYHPEQENVTARQLELTAELRSAIPNKKLELCFQPKAELATGRITGVEALARWNHPRYGAISPDEFIPLAEQAGLIDDLTDFVISESTKLARDLSALGLGVEVSVNIAARTLRDSTFPDRFLKLLTAEEGIRPQVKFEITEREIVLESATTNEVMSRLRAAGVKFSIDDFGTGYSSLAYLIQLPVDEVKVDKSFTNFVCDSPHHRAIVKSVVDIASTIGLTVVAEGVEDVRTWEVLGSLGCAEAQGYLLSRPLPAAALTEWLLERKSNDGPLFSPFAERAAP
jgi:diguanylate cyclase (GGDEF)-like protein